MIGIALFLLVGQERPWGNQGEAAPQSKEKWNVELVGWVDGVGPLGSWMVVSESGEVLYVRVDSSLGVIDISNPKNPYLYKFISRDGFKCNLPTVVDTFLYLWWRQNDNWVLSFYGISDPLNPILLKDTLITGNPTIFWGYGEVYGDVIYGFYPVSVDISDRLNPIPMCWMYLGFYHDHYFLYPYAYLIVSDTPYSYYYIIDVSNPYNMRLVHKDSVRVNAMSYPSGAVTTVSVWHRESDGRRFMYLLGMWDMFCFDVTNPTNPVKLNQWRYYTWPGYVRGSLVHGDKLYTCEYRYPSDERGLVVRALAPEPANPLVVGYYYHLPGDPVQGPFKPVIWVNGYIIGVVSGPGGGGIGIYRYSGESLPEDTGRYLDWITTVYRGPGLRFSISRKAEVSFKLYNILGQRVYERNLGVLEPGPHQVSLPDMGSGVYFLFMKADEAILRKKLIFLR